MTRYEDRLRAYARCENIRFVGWQDTAEFLETIDVLVVPSVWHEPLSRTVIEASAHGVPVLAAERGGIPEVVDVGKNGWLFDPDQPDALAEQLAGLVRDRSRLSAMGRSCLEKAQEFTTDRMTAGYLNIFNTVIRSRPS